MNLKKTAKVGMILAASAALVATLLKDKKSKQAKEELVNLQEETEN